MPDFGAWMGWNSGDLEEWYRQAERGDGVAFMTGHRGISLTLVRGATTLTAQTVLLAPAGRNTTAGEIGGDSGTTAKEQLLIVGAVDLNIQRGDQFRYPATTGRLNYEIVRVERALHGMTQAYAEEMQ